MKKSIGIIFLIFSTIASYGQSKIELHESDINEENNSFEYIIISEKDTVYKYQVIDYSVECELEYQNDRYVSFTFFDLLSGLKWSILYCKKENSWMKTDLYDKSGLGDKINFDDYCCKARKVKVLSFNSNYKLSYEVDQTKIYN